MHLHLSYVFALIDTEVPHTKYFTLSQQHGSYALIDLHRACEKYVSNVHLTPAFICFTVDYGNAIYSGLTLHSINQLQSVLNARKISNITKFGHIFHVVKLHLLHICTNTVRLRTYA